MSDLVMTTVPRDLYYHEVSYVRGLEQQHKEDIDRLEQAADALEKYKRVTDEAGAAIDRMTVPRPLEAWHEDVGPALWWSFPIQEPPYAGSPLDTDWPGYHTHWTPMPIPEWPVTADDGQFGVGA